ncbi:choline/ethanolamine kinase family protein [Hyphomicrobium sp.]|uniref:choline/ethanolamine kinase family protein n=1 Tax=Hyphomicrobium sp. TaxID=82 RepID=UPI002D797A3B|nr:choline/ethanolamine kinase family protein [Hyphomicrobium sp.]HET6388095.1 choline/ethanolamine kinase family protein [Hyphomicrobium sp.]
MTPEETLAALPIWRRTPTLVPLMQGRTNRNFIIQDGDERYFGRMGVDLPHHDIVRANEQACAKFAADLGVSPSVHYAADGILITAFLDGETLHAADMHDDATLEATAAVLRQLHSRAAPMTIPARCGVTSCRSYLATTPDEELPVPRESIMARLDESTLEGDRLVHADIIPENLMRTAGGLMLIDWEYSGRGAPETDLASVISNADLNPSETRKFLEAYGPHRPGVLEQQRVALIIREALWALAQLRHAGPQGDLVPYSKHCIDRMLKEFQ